MDVALARRITHASYLQGHFVLRSGQVSTTYFDKYRFEADPRLLRDVVRALVPLLPADAELLAGLELGGIPLATALSLETGLSTLFVRKAAKPYGTRRIAEGADFAGKRICLIEDVITTGGQVVESARHLRQEGGEVPWVVNVIWRGDDQATVLDEAAIQRISLFTMAELVQAG